MTWYPCASCKHETLELAGNWLDENEFYGRRQVVLSRYASLKKEQAE